ncbi:MAG: DUF6549 family protein [Patescibacteria group bacterium]
MKLRIYIILSVVIVVLIGTVGLQYKSLRSWRERHSQVLQIAKKDSLTSVIYKNQWGHEVAKSEILTLNLNDARKLATTSHLSFLTEIEGVKKNLKNLEQAVQVQAKLSVFTSLPLKDTLVVFHKDSVAAKAWSYRDKYNTLQGLVLRDSTVIMGTATVPLYGAVYWQRKKIMGLRIGAKKYFNEFTTPNHLVKITGSELIQIKKR